MPSGDVSDTLLYNMAKRAWEDGRRTVVFYFSDFDPSGYSMPRSVSRKLQAWAMTRFKELDIKVHQVGLTYQQAVGSDLPQSPLKPKEQRAEGWKQKWNGREQTEIDALAALRPEILDRITREALDPYFDHTLVKRAQEELKDWQEHVDAVIAAHQGYREVADMMGPELDETRHYGNEVVLTMDVLEELLAKELQYLEQPMPPEPEYDGEEPEPLFDSREGDFVSQTQKLIEHRVQGAGRAEKRRGAKTRTKGRPGRAGRRDG